MLLNIVIPNYSRDVASLWMLTRCVRSIVMQEPDAGKYILIVDDGSPFKGTKEHLDMLRRVYGVTVLECNENAGYSAAVNVGCAFASLRDATHVVTVNSDVEMLSPFVASLYKAFTHADVVGGLLLYPSGKVQSAGFEITTHGAPHEYDKNRYVMQDKGTALDARYVMGVTGALQAFSLEAGRYSERYRLSYEDVEFCLRQWREGKRVYFEPLIFGLHHESATRGYFLGTREMESLKVWAEDFKGFDLAEINSRILVSNRLAQAKLRESLLAANLRDATP